MDGRRSHKRAHGPLSHEADSVTFDLMTLKIVRHDHQIEKGSEVSSELTLGSEVASLAEIKMQRQNLLFEMFPLSLFL